MPLYLTQTTYISSRPPNTNYGHIFNYIWEISTCTFYQHFTPSPSYLSITPPVSGILLFNFWETTNILRHSGLTLFTVPFDSSFPLFTIFNELPKLFDLKYSSHCGWLLLWWSQMNYVICSSSGVPKGMGGSRSWNAGIASREFKNCDKINWELVCFLFPLCTSIWNHVSESMLLPAGGPLPLPPHWVCTLL